MTDAIKEITAQLAQLSAQLKLLSDQNQSLRNSRINPWLPLEEAATALHFRSRRALRAAIDRGRIPPQFVSSTTGNSGKRRTLYVDVQGFASHLSNK